MEPFRLQWISPTQGSNPGLPHCRQILYHMSPQGSPGASVSGIQNVFILVMPFQSWYVPVYPMYVFSLSSQNSVFWIFPRVFKLNYQFGCLFEPFQIHYLFLEASQKECHIMILGPSVFHKCYFLLYVPYCCPLFSCPWWLNHHMLDSP